MKHLLDLFPVVADRVAPPVLVALGPVWPVTELVSALKGAETTLFQFDVFQADRLREKLAQEKLTAEVVVGPDLWDLPAKFNTVIFPASMQADYELKLDMVEQGYHCVAPGGRFITLSEYDRDTTFHKVHKKTFGKCSESPFTAKGHGTAFWSTRDPADPPQARRRHRMTYHARVGDGASMSFESWPGTFSYGRMDDGSRAMLEVADLRPGDKVLDMGCGVGVVGCLAWPRVAPNGRVTFVDSSARAVKLAELNAAANGVAGAEFVLTANMTDLPVGGFDVVLANPPYFANSEVGRLFIHTAREVLRPGGRFYFVTKMPVQTIPEIVDIFGGVESVENRGYTLVMATA
ncbi:MAG: methyltransferase [Fimbriiglobus sp.]|jgi:16S rRNA (guanine1207-N2)-methyltransferase|nr:methyltransferase [Fimbriiglobus sp.]